MSLKTVLQSPAVILMLSIVAVGLVILLRADVLLGVIVAVPLLVCVWLVRRHHLALLREAVLDSVHKRKPFIIQDKEA